MSLALIAGEAHAAAFNVEAHTEAQAYEIRAYRRTGPNDVELLPVRRIAQYLGAEGYELVTGQDLGFEANLRVFSDFGLPHGEADLIDGRRTEDVDLMYANVRYRTGGLEGVLGRQYYQDLGDTFAFDGLKAKYLLKGLNVGAEAYAGLWVKGASLLGSPNYQLDGIREQEQTPSARSAALDPYLDEQHAIEPVFGAKVLAENVNGLGISGSAGYRQSTEVGNTTSQRLGFDLQYGSGYGKVRGLTAIAALEYDLIQSRISNARALARYDADLFAAQVEALRFTPTFSSYSIWYYFAAAPRDELRFRADYTPVGPLRYYAQVIGSHYNLNVSDAIGLSNVVASGEAGNGLTFGLEGGATLLLPWFHSGADVTWRNGWGGRQLWVDVTAGISPDASRWSVDGRFSYANVKDQYNGALRGAFYGAQVWGGYQLTHAARASLVVEENVNPFTKDETKVFFVVDLKAAL